MKIQYVSFMVLPNMHNEEIDNFRTFFVDACRNISKILILL